MPNYCPHCGERIRKLNPHRICVQKVALLEILAKLWDKGYDWVRVEEGRIVRAGPESFHTSYCARQHADRLVYFDLVNHNGPRSGEYQINQNGINFLLGKLKVPKIIYCKDGRVIEQTAETVFIKDVRHVVLDKVYWDNYAEFQIPDLHHGI